MDFLVSQAIAEVIEGEENVKVIITSTYHFLEIPDDVK